MQLLSSDWLKRMVKKSASTPEARIANLFIILQDWLDAPGMREQLQPAYLGANDHQELKAFLLALVTDTKLNEPEKLTFQLYFILLGALNEEIRNPGNNAMVQAGEAASNLIIASKPAIIEKPRTIALASVAVVAILAGTLLTTMPTASEKAPPLERIAPHTRNVTPVSARPDRLVAIYQMHEKIQAGQCSYPQALMLAPEQRAAFLEGVVNIDKLNTATTNLEEVSKLYQKVNCYYAPAAMLL